MRTVRAHSLALCGFLPIAIALAPACGGDDEGTGADAALPTPDAPPVTPDAGAPDAGAPQDIKDRLEAIPGLSVTEVTTNAPGYRAFDLEYEQPADHAAPDGQKFQQRMTLLHIDDAAPMVLHTSGYYVSKPARRSELTRLLGANQISVEHRFFEPSRPDPADWSLLTIEQSAADFHRIRQAFAGIYGGTWLGTGASKGGMTSVFHRRFYPADLDVTVAYVAPISLAGPDPRYAAFIQQGDEPACREALFALQQAILGQRQEVLDLISADATTSGWTFDVLGVEKAFEHAVLELPFYFWQYGDASLCPMVPAAGATAAQNYAFLNDISSVDNVADDTVLYYVPYFYQAGTQFGYPQFREDHIADLMEFEGTDVPASYVPLPGVPVDYDPASMPDVQDWVATQGERIIFIYGENDPWSAGMFELGNAQDSYLFVQPDGNHGARITALAPVDRDKAIERLEAWTGVDITLPMMKAAAGAPAEPEPVEPGLVP